MSRFLLLAVSIGLSAGCASKDEDRGDFGFQCEGTSAECAQEARDRDAAQRVEDDLRDAYDLDRYDY